MVVENQNLITRKYDEKISLKEFLQRMKDWLIFLLSKWIVIVVISMVGGVLGFLYASSKKPSYIATTTFVLEDDKPNNSANLAGLASIAGFDLGSGGGGIFQSDNLAELYKSRSMIEKTLFSMVKSGRKSESLLERYIEINGLRKGWENRTELLKINFNNFRPTSNTITDRLRDSVIGVAVKDIRTNYLLVDKFDKKLNIIKVEVISKDEVFAKDFNDAIVKNVNDFYIQTKTKKAISNLAILQEKTDSVKALMTGAIYKSASITDATPNLNPTRQGLRTAPLQKMQFTAESNKEILRNYSQNLELAKMSLLKETPLIQIIDNPIYPLEVKKLSKILAIIMFGFISGFMVIFWFIIRRVLDRL